MSKTGAQDEFCKILRNCNDWLLLRDVKLRHLDVDEYASVLLLVSNFRDADESDRIIAGNFCSRKTR